MTFSNIFQLVETELAKKFCFGVDQYFCVSSQHSAYVQYCAYWDGVIKGSILLGLSRSNLRSTLGAQRMNASFRSFSIKLLVYLFLWLPREFQSNDNSCRKLGLTSLLVFPPPSTIQKHNNKLTFFFTHFILQLSSVCLASYCCTFHWEHNSFLVVDSVRLSADLKSCSNFNKAKTKHKE